MTERERITVSAEVAAPQETVWKCWVTPEDIMQWNNASPDWHTPRAESDLCVGGTFLSRMEAKDGSVGFDFTGTFTAVEPLRTLAYTMDDGRTVSVSFEALEAATRVTETFEAEGENPVAMQRQGWQAILDNFKAYVEGSMKP